jgi:hypothetical protein
MESAIVGALITAVVTVVGGSLAVWREWRRRRKEAAQELVYRREQYLVESSADLSTRVWHRIRKLARVQAGEAPPWEGIYDDLLDLNVELVGQAPRYRLAGVEEASNEIFTQLNRFLSARSVFEGMAKANRDFYRLVLESVLETTAAPGAPASQAESEARAMTGFDDTDIDRAYELFREKTFAQVRQRVLQVLAAVSKHQPGQAFKLEENQQPYVSFDDVWAAVTKDTRVKNESQPAAE